MKIAFVHRWHTEGMGYTDNMLPKAMAKLGHEVHLITSNTQIYFNEQMYPDVYEPIFGPGITSCGVKIRDGVTIHRLPYYDFCPFKASIHRFDEFGIKGLFQYLGKIKPDVIQALEINSIITYNSAKWAKINNACLFTENHIHKSVFNPKNKHIISFYNNFNPFLKLINNQTCMHYPIAPDVAEISRNYYKVPKSKIAIQSLGVDTDLFTREPDVTLKKQLKIKHGFNENEIVAIYTGRITKSKKPMVLAEAIELLQEKGLPFRGLFIGNGNSEDINYIKQKKGCVIIDFMPMTELKEYYQLADIGVWPREESTAQLDAMACGLPLILSNKIKAFDRIEGNGLLYEEGDSIDLCNKILKIGEINNNNKLGIEGSKKVFENYSWDSIAKSRLLNYENCLKKIKK